ncbi:MAG: MliC family protein [Geminicoccaceae bacterium]
MRPTLRYVTITLGALGLLLTLSRPASAAEPSFDCAKVEPGSIEAMICNDPALAAADRKLAEVHAAAAAKGVSEHAAILETEEAGWIEGRDECWKSSHRRACIAEAYRLRTAELQARYRLIEPTGTGRYRCDGEPDHDVVATYFPTDPPTAIAERGDDIAVLYAQPAASGARYVGRNESIWEHQGEAMIAWGPGNPERRCVVVR